MFRFVSLFCGWELEGSEGDGRGGIIRCQVLLEQIVVLGATQLTHVHLLTFEPARQETLREALVVDAVRLLELNHGLRAQVANGTFNAG